MTLRELREHIDFQRYAVSTLKPREDNPTHGPEAKNVRNPWTGALMTNREFFQLHARLLAMLDERFHPETPGAPGVSGPSHHH